MTGRGCLEVDMIASVSTWTKREVVSEGHGRTARGRGAYEQRSSLLDEDRLGIC